MAKSRAEIRRNELKQIYLENGIFPPTKPLAKRYKVGERQIQKDIAAIVEEIKDPEIVEKIRRKFLEELRRRLPEMKDTDFVKLTKHFLAEKAEIKTEGGVEYKVTIVDEILDGNRGDQVDTTQRAEEGPPKQSPI